MESRDQASARRQRRTSRTERSAAQATLALILLLLISAFLHVPAARAAFGFKTLALTFTNEDSSPATQAGSHPFLWTTALTLNTTGPPGEEVPDGALKDLRIQLPAGLVGTPGLLPHCSHADFLTQTCPGASEVGMIGLHINQAEAGEFLEVPLFNLEPLPGNAAELALTAQSVPIIIELQIATRPPYNLIASITNASQAAAFFGSTLTINGVPGEAPFLTLPRGCTAAPASFEAAPWAAPNAWVSGQPPTPLTPTGCGSLPYSPTLTARPTTTAAAAPSGLDLDLDAPDEGIGSPSGTAHADTAAATLTLPAGLTVNPPIGGGLAACSPAELARETPTSAPGEGCPQAAKIGTASVTTPLFSKPIAGALYVAQPDDLATPAPGAENPFDSLLALYLVLRDPERGVLLGLPIRLDADPQTGRLTASFEQIPPLPLSHLALRFSSGPRAPLATPPECGSHAIGFSLTPSSGSPPIIGKDTFATTSGCKAAFAPTLAAGTTSYAAGTDAPFVLDLQNPAASSNLSALSLTLPPGLAADLTAATTCPEADATAAACPPDSRLGYARIALGTGAEPLWVPGGAEPSSSVYLAGPYRGAPYSLLISVPAAAGPYDLGRVVLRAPVRIDPLTAQATVEVADLPQLRDGIPLRYRAIRLVLDRPGFIRNPTSCEPARLTATVTASGGASAALENRFQAADCAALAFRPALDVRFSNPARNAHPRIAVELRPRATDANLAAASFTLPAGELLDLRRVRALCDRSLSPESCPAGSRLGRAVLASPLLRGPLAGPIYLRRPSGRLPDLIAELRGEGLRFVLRGHTAAPGGRLRVHFPSLPDIPLSKARFTFAGGRHGIFVNSASLCRSAAPARAALAAHNGVKRRLATAPRLGGGC